MKFFLISFLSVAIAAVNSVTVLPLADADNAAEQVEQSALADDSSYAYRRYRSGTGRREILS